MPFRAGTVNKNLIPSEAQGFLGIAQGGPVFLAFRSVQREPVENLAHAFEHIFHFSSGSRVADDGIFVKDHGVAPRLNAVAAGAAVDQVAYSGRRNTVVAFPARDQGFARLINTDTVVSSASVDEALFRIFHPDRIVAVSAGTALSFALRT